MQSLTIGSHAKSTPPLSARTPAELSAQCNGANIKTILATIAQAVREHDGIWVKSETGPDGEPLVEIEVFGVVAHGKDGPQTCRNWMIEAAKQQGRAA